MLYCPRAYSTKSLPEFYCVVVTRCDEDDSALVILLRSNWSQGSGGMVMVACCVVGVFRRSSRHLCRISSAQSFAATPTVLSINPFFTLSLREPSLETLSSLAHSPHEPHLVGLREHANDRSFSIGLALRLPHHFSRRAKSIFVFFLRFELSALPPRPISAEVSSWLFVSGVDALYHVSLSVNIFETSASSISFKLSASTPKTSHGPLRIA